MELPATIQTDVILTPEQVKATREQVKGYPVKVTSRLITINGRTLAESIAIKRELFPR